MSAFTDQVQSTIDRWNEVYPGCSLSLECDPRYMEYTLDLLHHSGLRCRKVLKEGFEARTDPNYFKDVVCRMYDDMADSLLKGTDQKKKHQVWFDEYPHDIGYLPGNLQYKGTPKESTIKENEVENLGVF